MFTVPLSLLRRLGDPDGGFTWQPRSGEVPSRGFAVAAYPMAEQVYGVRAATLLGASKFVERNARYWMDPQNFMGAWHNPVSHLVHLDISIVLPTEDEAVALCRRFKQLAYYDFARKCSVSVAAPVREVA